MKLTQIFAVLGLVLSFAFTAQAQAGCLEGVSIVAPGNASTLEFCPGDGNADRVKFSTTKLATPFGYVVVNAATNTIVYIGLNNFINFENFPAGTYHVYAFSFSGQITGQVGQNLDTAQLASICAELTINFITVNNTTPDAGAVSIQGGGNSYFACLGNGLPDLVTFTTTSATTPYAYLITNENNIIQAVVTGNSFDFENGQQGNSRVWGLAYVGTLLAQPGQNAATAILATECFGLSSNFIQVISTSPDGGTVSLSDGSTAVAVCTGGAAPSQLTFAHQSTSGAPYAYILTDANNIIISVLAGNSLNFNGLPNGTSRVWGLSYTGTLTAAVGSNAATTSLSNGCFDLSNNFVELIKQNIDGGAVSLTDGATQLLLCRNDLSPIVEVGTSSQSTVGYIYVLTDDNNVIIAASANGQFDLSNTPVGSYRIWGLAYTGNLTAAVGADADAGGLSDECFDLSDNFVAISVKNANGGVLALADGSDAARVCTGDGQDDVLDFSASGADGDNYLYVITDVNNVILDVSSDPSYNFEANADDIVRVWGLAYSGTLTASVGDNAATTSLSDGCFDLSDNFLTITRKYTNGGTVALADGSLDAVVCSNDNQSDVLSFTSVTDASAAYVYVLTDENNIIQAVLSGNSFDFNAVAPGVRRVWGLSFTGSLTAQVGDNAGEVALSDGCYQLSSNFVGIRSEAVEGGEIAQANGEPVAYTCPGDGTADLIDFSSTGQSTGEYVYVITDENNTILAISTDASFDFDALPDGNCRVWGLAYSGTLTAQVGDNAAAVSLSDECAELSSNFVTIIRQRPNGGTVATSDGLTAVYSCPGGNGTDLVTISATGASNTPIIYLLTDANNVIISSGASATIDAGALPDGEYRLWALAYTGNLTFAVGDNAAEVSLSDDCYSLSSNFITLFRQPVDGGTVALTDGTTNVFVCPGDDLPNVLEYASTGATGSQFTYVITTTENIIIAFTTENSVDISSLGAGNFRIWGLAYSGTLTAQVGDNAAAVPLSDGCHELSSNYIEVIREVPTGGLISTPDGATSLDLCVGDGSPDQVIFTVQGASQTNYAYLVTDEDDFLIGILIDDEFDFENAIGGNWKVYGIAYIGQLLPFPGDNINEVPLASQCWDLTDNFLAINKTAVNGGTIFGNGENQNLYICAGDGVADVVNLVNSSLATESSYQYVITTETNVILSLINGTSQNFENTGFTRLRVWGISYSGQLSVGPGNIITQATLSSGCYDLSDNFISVFRGQPNGGSISADGSDDDRKLCIGAVSGVLNMSTSSNSPVGYVYLVTTLNNNLVNIHQGNTIDFNAYNPGIYKIFGLSYTGTLSILPGQNVLNADLATSCYDLSDNSIEIIRSFPVDGGSLTTLSGETTIHTCPGDATSDVVVFITSSLDTNYRYVITNTQNQVLIPNINGNVIDFNAAGQGEIRVYGIAYLGNFDVSFGENVLTDELADDCFEVSENYISIIISIPFADSIKADNDQFVVDLTVGDGNADVVNFTAPGSSNTPYVNLITDENNIIKGIVTNDSYDFEGEAPGVLRVWRVAFTGTFTAQLGDDAALVALSDDCYDLSDNFVTVNLSAVNPLVAPDNQHNALVETQQIAQLRVMPNPVNTELTLQWESKRNTEERLQVRLLNSSGQLVRTYQLTTSGEGAQRFPIAVSDLLPGLYLLQVQQGDQVQIARFVKS